MEEWEEGDPVYWIELYQDKSRLIHENGIFDDVYLGRAALKSGIINGTLKQNGWNYF